MIDQDIADLLKTEAGRINNPGFIEEDPVQFPRRFESQADIEIAAILTAVISWGKRSMILRDADKMMAMMDHQPHRYLMEKGYEDLDPDLNIHRTFFGRHFQWLLRTLREIYSHYRSLDEFSHKIRAGESEAPAWTLAEILGMIGMEANSGETCAQCIPTNLKTTALKRINMALRWLVRDDGIVDIGVWKSIPKNKLFIPLDLHVGNVARELGLLDRKSNDRRSVEILTDAMRELCPEDPALLDFALFGLGVSGKIIEKQKEQS